MITLNKTLQPASCTAVPTPRRLSSMVGVASLLIGLGATPMVRATPLTLIFDEVLHGPILSHPPSATWPNRAGHTPLFVPIGLMEPLLDLTAMGKMQAVSDAILAAQVSGSITTVPEALRLVHGGQTK